MKIRSESFKHGGKIPVEFAFGKHHPASHMEFSANKNPHLAWSDVPKGAKSLVLICHDPDVPSKPDDVNKEGRTIPADLPRVDFFHWVLVDLKVDAKPIEAGEFSDQVTPRGKPGPQGPAWTRQGRNNYSDFLKGNKEMEGTYFGYDGPCPPWNDSIIHHYHFTIYAIDLDRCPVTGVFSGPEVLKAIAGHILDQASIMGTYTINPQAA